MRCQKLCRLLLSQALLFASCCQPFQNVTAVRVKILSRELPLPPQSLSVTSTKGVSVHPTSKYTHLSTGHNDLLSRQGERSSVPLTGLAVRTGRLSSIFVTAHRVTSASILGDIPYACDWPGCHNTFPEFSQPCVVLLQRIHTGDRPYPCRLCHAAPKALFP